MKKIDSESNFVPRILVVDDEPEIVRTLRTSLSSQGYLPHAVGNGVEGMIATRDWQPDLVITDISIPKMNGIEFCRQFRAISEAPIIVLSARTHEDTKIGALDAGADDYITKPFSLLELHARVRVLLRRHPPNKLRTQRVLLVGDFRIDVSQHRVIVRDRPIHLTPIQFDLLVCFAKHAGQVLTHRAILHEVWGTNDHRLDHLRVQIAELRKKIEPSASPRYIVTEPSIGYRFYGFGTAI